MAAGGRRCRKPRARKASGPSTGGRGRVRLAPLPWHPPAPSRGNGGWDRSAARAPRRRDRAPLAAGCGGEGEFGEQTRGPRFARGEGLVVPTLSRPLSRWTLGIQIGLPPSRTKRCRMPGAGLSTSRWCYIARSPGADLAFRIGQGGEGMSGAIAGGGGGSKLGRRSSAIRGNPDDVPGAAGGPSQAGQQRQEEGATCA